MSVQAVAAFDIIFFSTVLHHEIILFYIHII